MDDKYSQHTYDTLPPEIQKTVKEMLDAREAQTHRTWSYYEKIRKTDPKKYRDGRFHEQMVKDAIALGDKFKDGDYDKPWSL